MHFSFAVDFWVVLQLLILPVVLPMAVGLVSTRVTNGSVKAVLLLGFSVVTTFLTQLLAAYNSGTTDFDLGMALITSLVTFVLGVGVHFGLLKPTGVTDSLLDSGRTADGFGEIN